MSRRMLRKSSMKNSPLLKETPPSKKSSSVTDAFMFTVEITHGSICPTLDNSKPARKKNAAETPKASTRTKKSRNSLVSVSDDNNFTVPSKTASTEKRAKKVKGKKKIRYTEDLNAVEPGDISYFTEVKTKSKKTKRARLPSFLPQVDMVDEDKKSNSLTPETDSNNKENECNARRKLRPIRGRSRRTKKDIESERNSDKLTNKCQKQEDEIRPEGSALDTVGKSAHIGCSNSGSSANSPAISNIESDKDQAATNTPKLKREGTFEVSSADCATLLARDYLSPCKQVWTRRTYNVVPSPENKTLSTSNGSIETINLTESIKKSDPSSTKKQRRGTVENPFVDKSSCNPSEQTDHYNIACNSSGNRESSVGAGAISSNKKAARCSANKEAQGDRKSSFEVSFNINKNNRNYSSNEVLDNLNITRKTSREKSDSGPYHAGEDDAKGNFVTLRRQCHTMLDFSTENSLCVFSCEKNGKSNKKGPSEKDGYLDEKRSSDLSKYNTIAASDLGKKSISKSILKKPLERFTKGFRRDTFELVESYFDILDKVPLKPIPTTSTVAEVTPNNTSQKTVLEDIFESVSKTSTAELEHMMIGNEESVLVTNSFIENTKTVVPRVSRMSTFTKEKETSQSSETEIRRSSRKRWSQVERTPVFNKMPKVNGNDSKSNLILTMSKGKSVTFQNIQLEDDLTVNKMGVNKTKSKKSVKIESPLSTPKMRLHSPLVVRKTPKSNYKSADSSILAGNCADSRTPCLPPPSCSSTPYPKQKEASLLKTTTTTIEKSKAEKSIKTSSRVKMPNFRKIHERQFDKMENIRELQERKAMRAQYLMSGCKAHADTSASNDIQKESRKKLQFSSVKTKESKSKIQPSASNTPRKGSKELSKPPQLNMPTKRRSLEKKKMKLETKLPIMLNRVTHLKAGQSKINPENSGLSKPLQNMLNRRASLEKKHMVRSQESKVVTRFGFKIPAKEQLTKEDQIKAVSSKSKLTVNRREQNRQQFGAVRTNRRFELLMQMRAKNA